MIAFICGTTAELIKIAPVVHACRRDGGDVALWFTGFHTSQIPELLARLQLPEPEVHFAWGDGGADVSRIRAVPGWAAHCLQVAWQQRHRLRSDLRRDGRRPLVVVHGDTFTTVLGTLLGWSLGVPVAHVEAGLRSGSVRSPFPEELNRRLAGRLVSVHFPPTPREVANLRHHRAAVVLTGANTVVDSLKLLKEAVPGDMPAVPYGVSTLHRFELLQDADAVRGVLAVLVEASRRTPILFHAGTSERERFAELGLLDLFDDRLVLRPKLPYLEFLPVLAGAQFVVTDSGGLQEECAYLGIPCAVHRTHTERHQGLGENVVLTGLNLDVLRGFLVKPVERRRSVDVDAHRPSEIIADALASMGHL